MLARLGLRRARNRTGGRQGGSDLGFLLEGDGTLGRLALPLQSDPVPPTSVIQGAAPMCRPDA